MDSITATTIIRDSLRTNITDPYFLAGGNDRGGEYWIFQDEPIAGGRYPQIQIKKLNNPSAPIDIGPNYTEYEQLFLNIWFYTKNGFKITVSGTEYQNAQLAEYYQGLIKSTLKAQFNTLFTAGAKMYKHINTTTVEYDTETQLYFGAVTVRVAYFNT